MKKDKQHIDKLLKEDNDRLDLVNTRLSELKDNVKKHEWVQSRKNLIQDKIKNKPDRQPSSPDNITMKQHLQNLLQELNETPDIIINREISLLDSEKSRLEQEIIKLQKELDESDIDGR